MKKNNIKCNNIKQLELFDNQIETMLLTVEDIAIRLNVSPRTIRNWVYEGKIPFLKLNGAVRFDPSAISRWIEEENHDN